MAIGGVWAPGTWADGTWAEGTWALEAASPPAPAASKTRYDLVIEGLELFLVNDELVQTSNVTVLLTRKYL